MTFTTGWDQQWEVNTVWFMHPTPKYSFYDKNILITEYGSNSCVSFWQDCHPCSHLTLSQCSTVVLTLLYEHYLWKTPFLAFCITNTLTSTDYQKLWHIWVCQWHDPISKLWRSFGSKVHGHACMNLSLSGIFLGLMRTAMLACWTDHHH